MDEAIQTVVQGDKSIFKYLNSLQQSEKEIKAEIVKIATKTGKELPFHQACFLLRNSILSDAQHSIIDRYISVVQGFMKCGARLNFEFEQDLGTGKRKITALDIFASENAEHHQKLEKYRAQLIKYAKKIETPVMIVKEYV